MGTTTDRSIASRKGHLTREINDLELALARLKTFVPDEYLQVAIDGINFRLGQLKQERAELDKLSPTSH